MKLLEIKNLKTYFHSDHGVVRAVDGVSFSLEKGEVFGLVGESASGKTMTALSILNLLPNGARIESGEILFYCEDLLKKKPHALRAIRGSKISAVFQDPGTSLDPVFTIGSQMVEAITSHRRDIARPKARKISLEFLNRVHLDNPEKIFLDYPHELSGGMRQRIMIAMALLNGPKLLILDEPTTALDVAVQAKILNLLEEIIKEENLSVLFISHDMGVVSRMCDNVAIMHKGKIVETGATRDILTRPKEEYTMTLVESFKEML